MNAIDHGRVLLLGHTGKLGRALQAAFSSRGEVVGRNRSDFDAATPGAAAALLESVSPTVVLNTVAFQGLDAAWREPDAAFRLNALFPRELALAAHARGVVLAHFSTESVFGDEPGGPYTEADAPAPRNVYGLSKFAGETAVRALLARHYVFRLPMLFGPDPRHAQFVERLLQRARHGEALAVSQDVVTSPTYTPDVAATVLAVVSEGRPWGTYHVANAGSTSLHGFMRELFDRLGWPVDMRAVSHAAFPQHDLKNTHTPLASIHLPPLRAWQAAVAAYAREIEPVF